MDEEYEALSAVVADAVIINQCSEVTSFPLFCW
jgi:hypothetical protein